MDRAALVPRRPWLGRRVVLGVTGGIAAYKSVQVARDLTLLGSEVDVVMTRAAQRFVGPVSFEGVTGRAVASDLFDPGGAALHVRLGREADVVCVAPATAGPAPAAPSEPADVEPETEPEGDEAEEAAEDDELPLLPPLPPIDELPPGE